MTTRRPLSLLLCGLLLAPCAAARADVFVGEDDSGAVILTNIPTGGSFTRLIAEPREGGATEAVGPRSGAAAPPGRRFAPLISAAAQRYGLPEALLHAVIEVESNYNPDAVSPKGAVGLMQLMPFTARELGVADVRNPQHNIMGGARYLSELLGMFGNDLAVALAAYNAGPQSVIRSGNAIPPFAETRRYVPRVLELYQRNQARL